VELSLANESEEWVAVRSGLVIRETGAFSASSWPDGVYGTMVLASTNIPEGGQPPDYGILEANAALVILVVLGAVLAWRIGSRQRPAKAGAARTGG